MQYDYQCTDCGAVVTKNRKLADIHKDCECPKCSGDCIKVILKSPVFALDPFSGHFHQASKNWETHRTQQIKKEKHNSKEHGESGLKPL